MVIKLTKKHVAFSLIELMVVIAIIAVISVIAVIEYRSYTIRAKIAQAMVVFDSLGEQAKAYYAVHGYFPSLQQLNMAYNASSPSISPMASSLNQYVANYIPQFFLLDESSSYTCPAVGYGGYISNLTAGNYVTEGQMGALISVQQLLVVVNDTFKNYCQYTYYQYPPTTGTSGMTPISGDFIASCENATDDPDASSYLSNAGNQC